MKIDHNETEFDKIEMELYKNKRKHINKNNGNYKLKIEKKAFKFCKTYKTLEEAIATRNELLNIYYNN